MALAFWLAYKFPAGTIQWRPHVCFILGIFLIIAGVLFCWYAIHLLGESFTRNLAVHGGQKVVRAGPYHYIRHPSYMGMLLSLLGIGLALGNWASLMVLVLIKFAGLLYRVSQEERALCEVLGQPYLEYMLHTWRFIPYIF